MSKDTFIRGAMILTIAGIIVKIIGAVNRILLSRLLGGEGIGLYRDYIGAQRVFRISSLALTVTGFVFSLLLYVGAHWLVDTGLVRDPRAYWALVALSPAIFIVTIVSCLRGYFQGLQEMKPTAISQILEQLFRVVTMIAFAVLLLPYGLEYAAAGATFGAFPGYDIAARIAQNDFETFIGAGVAGFIGEYHAAGSGQHRFICRAASLSGGGVFSRGIDRTFRILDGDGDLARELADHFNGIARREPCAGDFGGVHGA